MPSLLGTGLGVAGYQDGLVCVEKERGFHNRKGWDVNVTK